MKDYLRLILISTLLMLGINALQAQYVVKESVFETTGVSNQGVVSGYENQAGPFSLWNPDQNTFYTIGGAAPGLGVGGSAKFSDDGNFISGSSYDQITLIPQWNRNVLTDYNYIFKAIQFLPYDNQTGFAAGQSVTYNGNGIILRTDNGGESWYSVWTDAENRGIEAMSFPSYWVGYVGGWNQYFARTQNNGWDWEILNPGADDNVYIYTGIAFKDEYNGVVTAQLDNGAGVYITNDGGNTWTKGSGLSSIPSKISFAGGDTYYLVTNGGEIQKSVDNGLTWSTVYSISDLFLGVKFLDEMTGIATSEAYIYKTTNGGSNWTQISIIPGATEGILWRDVAWTDPDNLVIVGTPDAIYESSDGGSSWVWANQPIWNGNPALYSIAVTDNAIHVSGSQGNFYRKSRITSLDIAEMSRYNVSTQEWTRLGSLGFILDNVRSGSFNISGDGNTIVGNAWADPANGNGTTPYAHGVAWNINEGIIDLGSLYANMNRSTRADAVSHDGGVVVGWQDFNGPWKAAVWRKNPAGGYFPNEYLLIDPNGDPNDEFNQLGQATAVSSDGNWIGGNGDFANNDEPWIWSESTGYISLGTLAGGKGRVAAINHDGSRVIGWFNMGPWDPELPFIWTPSSGIMNLNTFITETLGYTMNIGPVYSANAMSANGKYIAGWGFDSGIGPWGELFTFRLEIPDTPTNSSCEDAIALSCGDIVSASTVFADNNGGNGSKDLFYKYTGNGESEVITLSTCHPATSFPTTVRVFSDCSLSNQIDFNDSSCENQPFLSFNSDGTSTYIIMVEGYSSQNSGFFELSITCETLVNVDDQFLKGITLYPNPVKDRLNINAENKIETIEIFNINGQMISSENIQSSNYSLDFSSLKSGVYFVKAITNNTSGIFKVIKE
jgi:photosystem II stability/assembly factor-like uncharacterized protein